MGSGPVSRRFAGQLSEGYFPWTATGGGCTREPSGVIGPTTAGTTNTAIADPGFQCATQPTTPSFAAIPGNGAQQAATITGCTSNSPTGQAQVTRSEERRV